MGQNVYKLTIALRRGSSFVSELLALEEFHGDLSSIPSFQRYIKYQVIK